MAEIKATSKPSIELERILSSVSRLRPLPVNVSRILHAVDDPKTTAGTVSDLLALDQALTAYVLRVANSASLGYSKPCNSVRDAVMRLGFKQIRALALSTVAAGPLTRRLGGYRLGSNELWTHSVATAGIARWLAQAVAYPAPEEAYVGGLLHDMGKLLLDQFVMADYDHIVEMVWKRKMYLWQVEEQLFGIDHAGVGGLMASQWGFPAGLVESIQFHNMPARAQTQPRLAALVNIANAFTPQDAAGLSALGGRMIHPDSLQLLKLDQAGLERMRNTMLKTFSETEMTVIPPPVISADLL